MKYITCYFEPIPKEGLPVISLMELVEAINMDKILPWSEYNVEVNLDSDLANPITAKFISKYVLTNDLFGLYTSSYYFIFKITPTFYTEIKQRVFSHLKDYVRAVVAGDYSFLEALLPIVGSQQIIYEIKDHIRSDDDIFNIISHINIDEYDLYNKGSLIAGIISSNGVDNDRLVDIINKFEPFQRDNRCILDLLTKKVNFGTLSSHRLMELAKRVDIHDSKFVTAFENSDLQSNPIACDNLVQNFLSCPNRMYSVGYDENFFKALGKENVDFALMQSILSVTPAKNSTFRAAFNCRVLNSQIASQLLDYDWTYIHWLRINQWKSDVGNELRLHALCRLEQELF